MRPQGTTSLGGGGHALEIEVTVVPIEDYAAVFGTPL